MMHKAWSSMEEVPYSSSIKFQGHTGWKIDDLNPIWVRILGQSQLSNPPDLPCYMINSIYLFMNAVDFTYLLLEFNMCVMVIDRAQLS